MKFTNITTLRCTAAGIFLPSSLLFVFYFAIWAGYSFCFFLGVLTQRSNINFQREMPSNDGQVMSSPNF
jgi:hypothetical protein